MERSSFNDIIHKLNRKLFLVAYGILKNQQEAEDVVQEVFMKMWMMKDKLDEYNEPEALAVTMIRNNCIDLIRKWKHIDNEKDGSDVITPDTSPSPYDQLVNSENAKILNMIIRDLPDVYRELIEMKDIRGLSYVEISQLNNMNINTLRVNLSRARRIVKEEYSKYLYERRGTEKTAGEVL